jgi:putative transposase
LILPDPKISLGRQCELLGISRSGFYYEPIGESAENLALMALIDKQYIDTPFYGVGQFTYFLRDKGHEVNCKRVRRLLRLMALSAICPGPHTSKPSKGTGHTVYPYLLRGLIINKVGQVYGTDITYIPVKGGFLYLTAFIDWHSRYVVSWELSNSLETSFCLDAFDAACAVKMPTIINTDQGAQYTSTLFTERVLGKNIRLSMDGKGRAIDNIFTERLWRSLKYEEVYLRAYENGQDAWQSIDKYIKFYNECRPHSSLGGKKPKEVFFAE